MALNPTRQRIVNAAQGALVAKSHFVYKEIRPIPLETFSALMNGEDVTVTTDCSGLATCCYHRAGAPDPNGQDYVRMPEYTGTMMAHLPAIPLSSAHPGDLAVFGRFPGDHVVIIVGTGSDPACISHGGPGDPKIAQLSHFESIGPLTVLRGVPVVAPLRKRKPALYIVSGDEGQKISHTRHRRLWAARHAALMRHHQEHLHFDRIHHTQQTNAAIHKEE